MFTGIVEELGTVKKITGRFIEIAAGKVLEDIHIGDSIAVDGVCLTVTFYKSTFFCADVMPETMRTTILGRLSAGMQVNLERALALNARVGGHLVSGHVDGVGTIRKISDENNAKIVSVSVSPCLMDYIVPKGSIAINGVSLTVVDTSEAGFRVSLIPHTQGETDLHLKTAGDAVNIETDLISKYAVNLLQRHSAQPNRTDTNITATFLARYGFDT